MKTFSEYLTESIIKWDKVEARDSSGFTYSQHRDRKTWMHVSKDGRWEIYPRGNPKDRKRDGTPRNTTWWGITDKDNPSNWYDAYFKTVVKAKAEVEKTIKKEIEGPGLG